MKRLTNDQIMDYLDGTLSSQEVANIEAHLKEHAEDAELVRELQFALGTTKQWHAEEDLRVSENFWPELREKLGPAPKRSIWSRTAKSFNGLLDSLTPSPRASRWSLGAAVAAAAIALGAFFFAPQNASTPAIAISADDKAFIMQALEKHESYVSSQPVAGDASNLETGADEGEDDTIR